jgi:hypothetical protein
MRNAPGKTAARDPINALGLLRAGTFKRPSENVLKVVSPDLIHMEQYMDFLRNRMFRQNAAVP